MPDTFIDGIETGIAQVLLGAILVEADEQAAGESAAELDEQIQLVAGHGFEDVIALGHGL